jgi:uncharacterized protein YdhG (YjbR/CyaY superfamily)
VAVDPQLVDLSVQFKPDGRTREDSMKSKQLLPETVAQYIAAAPAPVRPRLRELRATIRKVVPQSEEAISYRIAGIRLGGRYLAYFAGFASHVSLYPAPGGDAALAKAMAPYLKGKATLRFPIDRPIPAALVAKVVKFMVKQHRARLAKVG